MKKNYKKLVLNLELRTTYILVLLCVLTFTAFSQVTYTFTNASATGSAGPTQAQLNAAYLLTNLNGSVTSVAGIQEFTVPLPGLYRITALGASGGDATSGPAPGFGASMQGDFNLLAGDVLRILVGQRGQDRPQSAGGGGGTFVTKTPHNTLGSILVIAGGGGASSADSVGYSASTGTCGTHGSNSGPPTCAGNGGISFTGNSGSGGGGFFTTGQNGGIGNGGQAYVLGGLGGSTNNQQAGGFGGGGGQNGSGTYAASAGGGFSGGNGGNRSLGRVGGGGGGSYNSGTNQVNSVLTTTGHGLVTITRLCNITLGTNTGSNLLCQGSALTLTTDAISNYTWSTGSNASSILVSPSVTTSYTLVGMSPSNCMTGAVITISVSNGVPILTITASSNSVCLNNTVSISAAGAITYSFSGGISNGVPFTPTATTIYTISGQNGCGTSTSLTTISIAPLPVIGIVSPTAICAGNTATLSGGGATTYTWLPGSIVGTSVVVSPQQNTTFTVTGETGNCLGTNTVALNVNPMPSLTVSTSNFSLCLGESATLTASGALNYTWQPGGSNGPSIVVSPTLPIAYTVIGENSFGCTASMQQPVIVYPTPSVNISNPSPTICPGATITLVSTGANTYSWSTGATTQSISVSPSATTVYTVTGTFTNSQCSSSKTIQVNVFVSSLAINSPTAVCIGSSATLQATGAGTYSWSTGSMGNSIVVSPTMASGYTVTGVSTIGGSACSSTASTQLAVNPFPTITIAASKTLICRYYESATLTASGASSYTWGAVGIGTTVVVSPTVNTTYTVVGMDGNGCQNTKTIVIRVYIDCWHLMGIDEFNAFENYISTFPNPSSTNFTIRAKEGIQLILINELGQAIRELELNAENGYSSEVKDLSKGIYFLNSKDPTRRVNKKIVVQ